MRPLEASQTIIDPQAPRAKSNHEPVADFSMAELFLRWLQTGTPGKQQAHGWTAMVLANGRLKIGGG